MSWRTFFPTRKPASWRFAVSSVTKSAFTGPDSAMAEHAPIAGALSRRLATQKRGQKSMGNAARAALPIPTESAEQIGLFRWAEFQAGAYPELHRLFHIPNGGHRHKATAGRLRAEGVKSGVPDICLPVPRGPYHGLYIEMKRMRGNDTSETQDDWLRLDPFNSALHRLFRGLVRD